MASYLLGYDIGSSSVKASLVEAESGRCVAAAAAPDVEMSMQAQQPGWAEQAPEAWWAELNEATARLHAQCSFAGDEVLAIGLSYQMHGLVCVDKAGQVLRPAIILCDSRAVQTGEDAFQALGPAYCLEHYLNSPGNFTASKLKWVMDHEPAIFERIHRVMLPGDYIAYRLSGHMATTVSGLSEGICWDFAEGRPARALFDHYGYSAELWCPVVPSFGEQGRLCGPAAAALGLREGIPLTYRAGDQPNNAYALQVLEPGELAATAGTSGVVYGVTDQARPDPLSRVNTFVHVNNQPDTPRNGVLLCINGTGISYNWLRRNGGFRDYEQMNALAAAAPPGAGGLRFFPFGNGAERVLENRHPGASFSGLDFNSQGREQLVRAVLEGIAFALRYGMEVMEGLGMDLRVVRAGQANLFLSPAFRQLFSDITGASVELFDTDGAQGAARAAGVGAGYYAGYRESYQGLRPLLQINPQPEQVEAYKAAYGRWKEELKKILS